MRIIAGGSDVGSSDFGDHDLFAAFRQLAAVGPARVGLLEPGPALLPAPQGEPADRTGSEQGHRADTGAHPRDLVSRAGHGRGLESVLDEKQEDVGVGYGEWRKE